MGFVDRITFFFFPVKRMNDILPVNEHHMHFIGLIGQILMDWIFLID